MMVPYGGGICSSGRTTDEAVSTCDGPTTTSGVGVGVIACVGVAATVKAKAKDNKRRDDVILLSEE
jgi:hypothetical protein